METSNENILIQKDLNRQLLSAQYSTETRFTLLQDLNYDCLEEIFQQLDLAAQFSLLISSQQFLNIILYDIWFPYYDNTFDITKDQSMAKHTKDFQAHCFNVVLKNFSRIKGISLEIFEMYMNTTTTINFPNILTLKIQKFDSIQTKHNTLQLQHFCKFPYLQKLQLESVCIQLSLKDRLLSVKTLILKDFKLTNDDWGNFLKFIFSSTLENLTLLTLRREHISFKHFDEINNCVQLKDLTINLYYLHDHRLLECILNMPSLQILTLESKDNFYFSFRDHKVFYIILSIFSQDPYRAVTGLQLNGILEKNFYRCPYLKQVKTFNWFVKKIFHRRLDGAMEWKSDVAQIISTFYEFVVNSEDLETQFVKNNIFHRNCVLKDVDFEEKIHELRRTKHY